MLYSKDLEVLKKKDTGGAKKKGFGGGGAKKKGLGAKKKAARPSSLDSLWWVFCASLVRHERDIWQAMISVSVELN